MSIIDPPLEGSIRVACVGGGGGAVQESTFAHTRYHLGCGKERTTTASFSFAESAQNTRMLGVHTRTNNPPLQLKTKPLTVLIGPVNLQRRRGTREESRK